MHEDDIDYLDFGETPPEGSQYWAAPFIMAAVAMHHFSDPCAPFVRSKGTVSGGVFRQYQLWTEVFEPASPGGHPERQQLRKRSTIPRLSSLSKM